MKGVILNTVAVGMLFTALCMLIRRLWLLLNGVLSEGVVEEIERSEIDDIVAHYPVVAYLDEADTKHRVVTGGNLEIGDKVTVLYSRANPKHAYMTGFIGMWALPLGVFTLGAIMFLCLLYGVP